MHGLNLNSMRIILFALVGGVVMFTVVVLAVGDQARAQGDALGILPWIVLAVAVMQVPTFVVVRGIFVGPLKAQYRNEGITEGLKDGIGRAYLMLTLIMAAMIEGVALFGIVTYMLTGNVYVLAAPVLGASILLSLVPSMDKLKQFGRGLVHEPIDWGPDDGM